MDKQSLEPQLRPDDPEVVNVRHVQEYDVGGKPVGDREPLVDLSMGQLTELLESQVKGGCFV
jgi:hypothetical protein